VLVAVLVLAKFILIINIISIISLYIIYKIKQIQDRMHILSKVDLRTSSLLYVNIM